jgi:alcohol dehydrogenase class IV
MKFEFATAGRILFGEGTMADGVRSFGQYGKKALIVSGKGGANPQQLVGLLEQTNLKYQILTVNGEPTVEMVRSGCELAKNLDLDYVIAYGGGSVIDAGKAISGLLTNPGDILDYLEVVGNGRSLANPACPMIAIPTTAGTGSEVTRNAVITVADKGMKVSLRSPYLLPELAIVDPELTYSMPPEITASTGMDALAQVIEPYVTRKMNPLVDLYCEEGMKRAGKSLLAAYQDGENVEARNDMCFTSLMGGLALANAGLGAVHGFAAPIGGMFNAPHGVICARLLPGVVEANTSAVLKSNDAVLIQRYHNVARWITGNPQATIHDLVQWLQQLCYELLIPRLSAIGIRRENFADIATKASIASSMQANPVKLSQDELIAILENSL